MLNFEETSRPDPVRVLPAYKEHPDLGRDGSIEAQSFERVRAEDKRDRKSVV